MIIKRKTKQTIAAGMAAFLMSAALATSPFWGAEPLQEAQAAAEPYDADLLMKAKQEAADREAAAVADMYAQMSDSERVRGDAEITQKEF